MDSVGFLNSLLDKIDSSKNIGDRIVPQSRNELKNDTNVTNANEKSAVPDNNRNEWFEYYDSSSGKHYYHDRISGATTWDKPADFEKHFSNNRISSSSSTAKVTSSTGCSSSSTSSLSSPSSSTLPSLISSSGLYATGYTHAKAHPHATEDYRVFGTFNRVTGRFTNAGPESYWDKVSDSSTMISFNNN